MSAIYTLEAQIACVRRELTLRKNVYPKWVGSGRMKAEAADHEINCMQAVHDTLTRLNELTQREYIEAMQKDPRLD